MRAGHGRAGESRRRLWFAKESYGRLHDALVEGGLLVGGVLLLKVVEVGAAEKAAEPIEHKWEPQDGTVRVPKGMEEVIHEINNILQKVALGRISVEKGFELIQDGAEKYNA